jgi:arsenate reductase
MSERLVVFVCVENAGRSLMAEAAFNAIAPPGWRAASAGTQPAAAAHHRTGPMLSEIGLEIPPHPPTVLSPALLDRARVRVTMGCGSDAACPAYLRRYEFREWALEDPGPLDDDGFRRVRDQIVERVRRLRTERFDLERSSTEARWAPGS